MRPLVPPLVCRMCVLDEDLASTSHGRVYPVYTCTCFLYEVLACVRNEAYCVGGARGARTSGRQRVSSVPCDL